MNNMHLSKKFYYPIQYMPPAAANLNVTLISGVPNVRNCCIEYILPEVMDIPGMQVLYPTADLIAREPQPKAALATGSINFGKQDCEVKIWLRIELLVAGMDRFRLRGGKWFANYQLFNWIENSAQWYSTEAFNTSSWGNWYQPLMPLDLQQLLVLMNITDQTFSLVHYCQTRVWQSIQAINATLQPWLQVVLEVDIEDHFTRFPGTRSM